MNLGAIKAVIAKLVGTLVFVALGAGTFVATSALLMLRKEPVIDPGFVVAVGFAHGLALAAIMAAIINIPALIGDIGRYWKAWDTLSYLACKWVRPISAR